MEKVIIVLRGLLLVLSLYGYIQFLQKKIQLNFTLPTLLSGIGSVMFLAGILNVLQETAWLIFLFGLWLCVKSIGAKEPVKDVFSAGILFTVSCAAFFLFLLYDSEFLHYDNFSHWAVAPQIMISQDRFPNFSDNNYMFTSYPLGSASFIYFVATILGFSSEWVQMFAQAFCMVGMLAGLFAFGKKPHFVLLAWVSGIFLLCGNTPLVDLLVDSLLPIVALSTIAFCVFYRQELPLKLYYLIPYCVFLVSIKNSGILFALLAIGYACTCVWRDKEGRKRLLHVLLSVIVTLILWQKHAKLVFWDGLLAKHSMSVSNLLHTFESKRLSDIITITKMVLHNTLSASNHAFWALLFMLIVWIVWKYVFKTSCRDMRNLFLFSAVAYGLYQLGTLGMYLFSMPDYEASILAGYDRYHQTIVVLLTGLCVIELMLGFSNLHYHSVLTPPRLIPIAFTIASLISFNCILSPRFSYLHKQHLENTDDTNMTV